MFVISRFIIALLLAGAFYADTARALPPDCAAIQAITGGEPLPWLGYDNGGWDLPDDIALSSRVDFAVGGVWEFTAESEPGTRWLWWFADYVVDGEPRGMHNFCAVVIK